MKKKHEKVIVFPCFLVIKNNVNQKYTAQKFLTFCNNNYSDLIKFAKIDLDDLEKNQNTNSVFLENRYLGKLSNPSLKFGIIVLLIWS